MVSKVKTFLKSRKFLLLLVVAVTFGVGFFTFQYSQKMTPLYINIKGKDLRLIQDVLAEEGVFYRVIGKEREKKVLVHEDKISALRVKTAKPLGERVGKYLPLNAQAISVKGSDLFGAKIVERRLSEILLARKLLKMKNIKSAQVHLDLKKEVNVHIELSLRQMLSRNEVKSIETLVQGSDFGLNLGSLVITNHRGAKILSKSYKSQAVVSVDKTQKKLEKMLSAKLDESLKELLGHDDFFLFSHVSLLSNYEKLKKLTLTSAGKIVKNVNIAILGLDQKSGKSIEEIEAYLNTVEVMKGWPKFKIRLNATHSKDLMPTDLFHKDLAIGSAYALSLGGLALFLIISFFALRKWKKTHPKIEVPELSSEFNNEIWRVELDESCGFFWRSTLAEAHSSILSFIALNLNEEQREIFLKGFERSKSREIIQGMRSIIHGDIDQAAVQGMEEYLDYISQGSREQEGPRLVV